MSLPPKDPVRSGLERSLRRLDLTLTTLLVLRLDLEDLIDEAIADDPHGADRACLGVIVGVMEDLERRRTAIVERIATRSPRKHYHPTEVRGRSWLQH